jgi:hypothetical protein
MRRRTALLLGGLALALTLGAPTVGAGDSSQALRVARESQARWTIGSVRARQDHGRVRVQADLMADGVVIAHLRLDPKTGEFVADKAYTNAVDAGTLARLNAAASRALSQVEVGGWAWPAEHGRWRVALRYKGRPVGTVTVDVARERLVGRQERKESESEEEP